MPKKLLVYGAMFNEEFNDAIGFGWAAQRPPHDWKCECARMHQQPALSSCFTASGPARRADQPPCWLDHHHHRQPHAHTLAAVARRLGSRLLIGRGMHSAGTPCAGAEAPPPVAVLLLLPPLQP